MEKTTKKKVSTYSKDNVLALLQRIIDDYEANDDRVKAADYLRAVEQINKMQGHYDQNSADKGKQEIIFRFD